MARLIDSYAEGLLEKHEFEPRITRLRQRIAALAAQRQQRLDEAAFQTELRLIIGRLEDFATQIDTGLEEADGLRKRERIRALVKRVEVTQDQVNVVFRVDSYQGESDPEKKVCNFVGGVATPPCGVPLSGYVSVPASRTPAFSHVPISLSMPPSLTRCVRHARRWPWSMGSKHPRTSASTLPLMVRFLPGSRHACNA